MQFIIYVNIVFQ